MQFGQLEMRDRTGIVIFKITKGLNPFFSSYSVSDNVQEQASLIQKFSLRPNFDLEFNGRSYQISGNIRACDFTIVSDDVVLARIAKRSLRWGDTYILSIQDLESAPILCAITVCLDNALFHNLF